VSQHFIENIKIENFKCFENLEINDFKRVNVFGGKNNVGKTALLEAIELLVKSPDAISLGQNTFHLLRKRQENQVSLHLSKLELDLFKDEGRVITIKTSACELIIDGKFEFKDQLGNSVMGLSFKIDNHQWGVLYENFISTAFHVSLNHTVSDGEKKTPITFIVSSKISDNQIANFYGMIVEFEKEDFLNESLNSFDSSLLSLKVIVLNNRIIPKFKIIGRSKLVSLSEMGDGINRYIAILCAIWASQNGFLFIDEIENGIHYSNYKKLWELIFMASEQANCQVFVTTHSKECITAFNKVQQERNDDAGRYFELFKSKSPKKQKIMAAVRDTEQLQYALENDKEIRGE